MRIMRLDIHGFGIYRDFFWDSLAPGLNVIEGPNEAGKSTLMAFIRAVLFGFAGRRGSENRYELSGSRRYGGSLVFEDEKGLHYTVERHAGGASGKVMVHLPDRTVAGESVLHNIWGGVTGTLYKNVFAFGLEELERLDSLQNSEVSGYIYSAGMGTGSVSLVEVEKKLKIKLEELYKSGGQKPKINNIIRKMEKLDEEIEVLKEIPFEYNQLQKERQEVAEMLEQTRNKLSLTRRLISKAEKAVLGREFYEQLLQINISLEHMPELQGFPENALEKWERADYKLAEKSSMLEKQQFRLRELREELEKLSVNEEILKLALDIELLLEERRVFVEYCNSLSGLRQEAKSVSEESVRILKTLGYSWSFDSIREFSCSVVTREQVRTFKDSFRRQEERINEQLFRLRENDRLLEKCRLEKSAAAQAVKDCPVIMPPTSETWTVRSNSLQKWQAGCSKLERREQDLRYLADRRKDMRESHDNLKKSNPADNRVAELLAFLFLITFGLLSVFYFRNQLIVAAVLMIFISSLLVLYIVLYQNRRIRHNQYQEELSLLLHKIEEVDRQLAPVQSEILKERQKLQQLAMIFCGKSDPVEEEVFQTVKELEEEERFKQHKAILLKELMAKEEEMNRLLEFSDRYSAEMKLLEDNLTVLKQDWNSVLDLLGIKQEISPGGLEELLLTIEKAQNVLESKDKLEQQLGYVEEEIASYTRRVNTILSLAFSVKKPTNFFSNLQQVKVEDIAATVLQIKDDLSAARLSKDNQKIIMGEINKINTNIEEMRLEVDKLKQEQYNLMLLGKTDNAEEFRQLSILQQERRKLICQKAEAEKNLRLIAGSKEKLAEINEILKVQDDDDVKEDLLKLQQEYEEMEKEYSFLTERKGQLTQRIADLEKSDRLAGLMLSKEGLLAELSELIEKWSVASICQKLLAQAREGYERERQPAVLKRASRYFKTFTGGKYNRILVPLGKSCPEVEKEDLTRLGTGELSRGTAEQLYLAMRFALVREFADRVVSLPVLMDDILVNFDPGRMRSAVEAIGELSRQHQVLFFTCHPHVAQALVEVDFPVKYISLSQ
ncbi:conserved hypothetical protein [Desulfofarcimen acetoxidans DSM 771]|uniref:YhaN AAA domain-containing protein n=1 Tax=Desulfofarcimen acetoxidans (strain ATCC 49208 / DSM 771 / KCTC 5769 / VKM B-1644 / 5575) TaxID=485916 RepID=C8VX27_DESAS|nr:AAA family ATPase [Desulfofarcimen acetoxidans]ACV62603.1 conserved hypothetical protein [Desulfofarcimen acetoxidans DSM 771]